MKDRRSSKEIGSRKEETVKVTATEVDFEYNLLYGFFGFFCIMSNFSVAVSFILSMYSQHSNKAFKAHHRRGLYGLQRHIILH